MSLVDKLNKILLYKKAIKDAFVSKGLTVSNDMSTYAKSTELFMPAMAVSEDGILRRFPSTPHEFAFPSGATSIPEDTSFASFLISDANLTAVDASSLVEIKGSFTDAFRQCTSLTSIDFSNLEKIIGDRTFSNTFSGCTALKSVSFPKLVSISGGESYVFNSIFRGCTALESVDLSKLAQVVSSYGLSGAFSGCTSLQEISFDSLFYLSGDYPFSATFDNCTALKSVSFPALKTILPKTSSIQNTFSNMLRGTNGCTVHFPSNWSSIASWSNPSFGGSNVTLLFDLPSTADSESA